jgi:hypothetical protein
VAAGGEENEADLGDPPRPRKKARRGGADTDDDDEAKGGGGSSCKVLRGEGKAGGGAGVGRGDEECVVCMDAVRTHIFAPCGHVCACAQCARKIVETSKRCPKCRATIAQSFRAFF